MIAGKIVEDFEEDRWACQNNFFGDNITEILCESST